MDEFEREGAAKRLKLQEKYDRHRSLLSSTTLSAEVGSRETRSQRRRRQQQIRIVHHRPGTNINTRTKRQITDNEPVDQDSDESVSSERSNSSGNSRSSTPDPTAESDTFLGSEPSDEDSGHEGSAGPLNAAFNHTKTYEMGKLKKAHLKATVRRVRHMRLKTLPYETHMFTLQLSKEGSGSPPLLTILEPLKYALRKLITRLQTFYGVGEGDLREVRFTVIHNEIPNGLNTSFHLLQENPASLGDAVCNMLLNFLKSNPAIELTSSFEIRVQVIDLDRTVQRMLQKGINPPSPPTFGSDEHDDNNESEASESYADCWSWFVRVPNDGYGYLPSTMSVFRGKCVLVSMVRSFMLLQAQEDGQSTKTTKLKRYLVNLTSSHRSPLTEDETTTRHHRDFKSHMKAGLMVHNEVTAFLDESGIPDSGPYDLSICQLFALLRKVQIYVWKYQPGEKGGDITVHDIFPKPVTPSPQIRIIHILIDGNHCHVIRKISSFFNYIGHAVCMLPECLKKCERLNRHRACQSRHLWCGGCERLLLLDNLTAVNAETKEMLATTRCISSGTSEQEYVCAKCGLTLKGQECERRHKKSVCMRGVKCQECTAIVSIVKGQTHSSALENHVCFSQSYCYYCYESKERNMESSHHCKMTAGRFQERRQGLNFVTALTYDDSGTACEKCLELQIAEKEKDQDNPNVSVKFNLCDKHQKKDWQKSCEQIGGMFALINDGQTSYLTGRYYLESHLKYQQQESFGLDIEDPDRFIWATEGLKQRKSSKAADKKVERKLNDLSRLQEKFRKVASTVVDLFIVDVLKNGMHQVYITDDHVIVSVLSEKLMGLNLAVTNIMKGCQLICAELEYFDIRFVTFKMYSETPILQQCQNYGIRVNVPYFPLKHLGAECRMDFFWLIYDAEIPNLEHYSSIMDSVATKNAKRMYIQEWEASKKDWNFKSQLFNYCVDKVTALAQVALLFIKSSLEYQDTLKASGACIRLPQSNKGELEHIHPFSAPYSSIAGYAFGLCKSFTLDHKQIYSISQEYSGEGWTDKVSRGEHQFLSFMAHQYPDQFIRHAFNATDGQVQIRYGKGSSDRLKPDGYVFDEEKKEIKILEYMGCYFHGHYDMAECTDPRALQYPGNMIQFRGITFEEARRHFFEKRNKCKHYLEETYPEMSVHLIIMWECQFEEMKRNNADLKSFLNRENGSYVWRPLNRCKARNAIKGNVPLCLELYFGDSMGKEEEVLYQDVNGLHSMVAVKNSFPVGDYNIIQGDNIGKKLRWESQRCLLRQDNNDWVAITGICMCNVLAPEDLVIPYLPNTNKVGKTLFSLCAMCAQKKADFKSCSCKRSKRSFKGTYTIADLIYSITLGYEILEVYEILFYTREEPILRPFYSQLYREKLRVSLPPNQTKQSYVTEVNNGMNYSQQDSLKTTEVCSDPVYCDTLKKLLNLSLGRFGMNRSKTETIVVRAAFEFEDVFLDKTHSVVNVSILNQECALVTIQKKAERISPNRAGSSIIYAHILAYSRIYMYEQLKKLQLAKCTPMLIDIDAILYRKPKHQPCPLTIGLCHGDFKNLFGNNSTIINYVALGARTTKIVFRNNDNNELGVKLRMQAFQLQSAETTAILDNTDFLKLLQDAFVKSPTIIGLTQSRRLVTDFSRARTILKQHSFSANLCNKRMVIKLGDRYVTLPYGYMKPLPQ